jgi:hypothetical protein
LTHRASRIHHLLLDHGSNELDIAELCILPTLRCFGDRRMSARHV